MSLKLEWNNFLVTVVLIVIVSHFKISSLKLPNFRMIILFNNEMHFILEYCSKTKSKADQHCRS